MVLYSPGVGDPRTWNTTQVEDLAGRGYVVVTVDHTYDSAGVEFPGRRVERSVLPDRQIADELIRTVYDTRVADTRFVLDQLPFIEARVLGSRTSMDLGKVGMFGHWRWWFGRTSGAARRSAAQSGDQPGRPAVLYLKNSAHASFTDAEAVLPQLGTDVSGAIGTVDPARAVAANRAYTASFFDRFLRHRDDHLLDGPSPVFPEVEFVS